MSTWSSVACSPPPTNWRRSRRAGIHRIRGFAHSHEQEAMNVEQARFNMIEQQIRPWDVLDQSVLSLLAVVKRANFVPPAYRALAFVETDVPLPAGQSMLAPKVDARLLQELDV